MKKTLSLLLAVLMLVSCVPVFASAAETLKATNVTKWPTITYKNGGDSINFGQTVGDTIIINDDEIVLDAAGNQVAGHFEHQKPTRIPDANDAAKANLTFVPDDTTQYSGFNKLFSKDVTFKVNKVTPVPVDENNAFPVATEVEAGANLSTSILTSPEYTNPHNAEEPKILAAKWSWYRSDNVVVNESGYYQAFLSTGTTSYTDVFTWVLVRVKGDTSEIKISTSIEEKPTVVGDYCVGDKLSDVKLSGGKAVDMNGEEVSGTFAFEGDYTFKQTGINLPTIVFTPDDSRYATAKSTINLTIKKSPIRFVDADGNDIIPEITTITDAVFGDTVSIGFSLMAYLNSERNSMEYFDMEGNPLEGTKVPIGRNQFKVKVTSKDEAYEPSMLTFILNCEPTYFTATANYNQYGKKITVSADSTANLPYEFDVYVDGELIGTTTDKSVKWSTDVSGTYDVKLAYNDPEGRYVLENAEQEMAVLIRRDVFREESGLAFTVEGGDKNNNNYAYMGNVLTLTCTDASFYNWKITVDGKEWIPEGLTAEDMKKSSISFTMPDCNIVIAANSAEDFASDAECDHLCHKTGFLGFIWKVISFLQRFFGVQQYCDCGILHYDEPILNLGL